MKHEGETSESGYFRSPFMYEQKMKLAVLHFNALRLETMLGMREEKGSTTARVKGRDTLSIKRHYSPAMHDWRRAIVDGSITMCREKRNERLLEKLGAPSTEVLEKLLEEEKEEVQVMSEESVERGRIREDGEGEEEEAYERFNLYGMEDEWEEESVGEEEEKESEDSGSEESDWDENPAPPAKVAKKESTRGRGRGSTVVRRVRGGRRGRGGRGDRLEREESDPDYE